MRTHYVGGGGVSRCHFKLYNSDLKQGSFLKTDMHFLIYKSEQIVIKIGILGVFLTEKCLHVEIRSELKNGRKRRVQTKEFLGQITKYLSERNSF